MHAGAEKPSLHSINALGDETAIGEDFTLSPEGLHQGGNCQKLTPIDSIERACDVADDESYDLE
eukprot:6329876-Heterocapsa_arctica.AAC.1